MLKSRADEKLNLSTSDNKRHFYFMLKPHLHEIKVKVSHLKRKKIKFSYKKIMKRSKGKLIYWQLLAIVDIFLSSFKMNTNLKIYGEKIFFFYSQFTSLFIFQFSH